MRGPSSKGQHVLALLLIKGLSYVMKSITSQYLNFMNVNQIFVQT